MDPEDRRAVADALRERAEAALASVHDRFGDAPRREPLHFPTPGYEADSFPSSVGEQLERIGGIAGALVTDDAGRVLCVDVSYYDVDWQTPGGAVERSSTSPGSQPRRDAVERSSTSPPSQAREDAVDPGDALAETARREVREETGVEAELSGLLYTRPVEYDYGYPEVATLPMAVFTGRKVGGSLSTGGKTLPDGSDEIADVAWFPPKALPEDTLDREWILGYCGGDG